jgi:hypothetical protein
VRHIPEWASWLSYKPLARYGYDLGQEVLHGPMEFVKESIVSNGAFENIRCFILLAQWQCPTVACSRVSARDGEPGGTGTRKGGGYDY